MTPEFKTLTLITTIVDPNGPGGCNGPPLPVGVARITRRAENGATLTRTFGEPRADLLDVDLAKLSDAEILRL
jgi:hypothetical protein